jgi:hypothetical protein
MIFNTEGNKTKVMAMTEGDSDITTNDRRFTIEKRGNPAGTVAWRIRTSNDQIDTQGAERVVRHFDPSHTYFWKAVWGGNRFNLQIKDGGANGTQIYSFGKGHNGLYDPHPTWRIHRRPGAAPAPRAAPSRHHRPAGVAVEPAAPVIRQ